MDINKYESISADEYSVVERTKQSLCSFLIKPINISGLAIYHQFIYCTHEDTLKLHLINYSSEPIYIDKGQVICNLYESRQRVQLTSKLIYELDFILSDSIMPPIYENIKYNFIINIIRDSAYDDIIVIPESNLLVNSNILYMPDDIVELYEAQRHATKFGHSLYMPYDIIIPPRSADGIMSHIIVNFYIFCHLVYNNIGNNKFIIMQSELNTKMYSPACIYSRNSHIFLQFNNLSNEPILLQKGMSYNKIYSYTTFEPTILSIS